MRRDRAAAALTHAVSVPPVHAAARSPLPAPVAALVLTYLMLSRPQLSVLAAGAMVLGLLAVSGPGRASPWLVPVALLGAVQSGGPVAAFGGVAAVTVAVVLASLTDARGYGVPHCWTAFFGLLLLASFLFPAVPSASATIVDIAGLLAGLLLLAAVTAFPPSPGVVARVTAVAGSLAGAYVLAAGDHAGGRLEGLGLNPNYLGAMLVLPFVAAAGLTHRTRRPGWLLPAAFCFAGIVATQSRGAFIASLAGAAVIVVQGRSRAGKAVIVLLMAGAGAVLPGLLGAVEHVATGSRPAAQLSSNTSAREHAARFAADVALAHPLRGIGYGMFPSHAAKSPMLGLYIATHDDYLRLAAESGLVTLAVFLTLLWLGVRGARRGDLAVLRAVVVAYATGLFFANQLANLVVSMPFWLSLGCLLASPPATASDPCEESGKRDRQPG